MVSTNNFEIYNILKCLRAHGWTRDLDVDSKISKDFLKTLSLHINFYCQDITLDPMK